MQSDHPSKDIIGSESRELEGKTICVCITGSVAVSNVPGLCRQLMRCGAEVYCVMSPSATRLIHPDLLHWATGNSVITKLTGNIEHVILAGERPGQFGKADVILVCPATANTISKIACGIDDTPVTTVVTTAFGSKTPIIIVPAMHESMYKHPIIQENIEKLRRLGVDFIQPRVEENKAKIAETNDIIFHVMCKIHTPKDLLGVNFLITAGPCREYLDPIRFITNPSTGRMGVELAREIKLRDGEVTLILGKTSISIPPEIQILNVETSEDYLITVTNELKNKVYDVFISSAAISDFRPSRKSSDKLQSDAGSFTMEFLPTPKIIKHARELNKKLVVVAFKAESNLSEEELLRRAYSRLMESDVDLMVANDVGKEQRGFESNTNEVFIIDKKKKIIHIPLSTKQQCSVEIINQIKKILRKN